ncbi:protocadherin-7-like [Branchiostoma floridae]|uniref:Protocadherin-7-like n=1 Tax=Branchiostoma floridae TaxID=7739 RepID=A0A9J7LFA0_BRAFL|nr:protocadherin-7-like [Branchiostoma floridae]
MAQVRTLSMRFLLLSVLTVCNVCGTEVRYSVLEEEPPNTYIGNLARDLGVVGAATPRTFAILSNSSQSRVTVDEVTGVLSTDGRIDRDVLCPRAQVCEVGLEVAMLPKQFFQLIQVRITVEDQNDNTPRFRSSVVTLDLSEATAVNTRVPLDSATDLDSERFSVQTYTLQTSADHAPFDINIFDGVDGSKNVELVVAQALDREARSFYRLVLTAFDGGNPRRYDSQVLNVNILDTNDNSPVFEEESYSVSIMENSPVGTLVLDLNATDPDEGTNGEVVYSFSNSMSDSLLSLFALDPITGRITINAPLDRESAAGKVYQLTVQARDRGVNSAPTFATVLINVGDTNDNAPLVTLNFVTSSEGPVYLSEDVPVETFLAYLTVSDRDGGRNGRVNVTLDGANKHFKLQSVPQGDGQFLIVTSSKLDRETLPTYNVTVIAKDAGKPPKVSYKSFDIILMDVNDNSPDFGTDRLEFELAEEGEAGTYVGTATATDPDQGANGEVVYSTSDGDQTVYVDPENGNIIVNEVIDRETREFIQFTMVARDGGVPSRMGSVLVTIRITDKNDNAPAFTESTYPFYITESVAVGTSVGTVVSTDADIGRNAKRRYRIIQGNEEGKFSINPENGVIYTADQLDYEQVRQYELIVEVRDSGVPQMSDTCLVRVFVQDENDNRPEITFPNNRKNVVYVPLTAPVGYLATSIQAVDWDEGPNGELSYSITNGNRLGIFVISELGDIRTVKLIKPDWAGLYTLTVMVTDHGATPSSATTLLNIFLSDAVYNGSTMIGGDLLPANVTDWNRFNIANTRQKDDGFSIPIIIVIALSCALVLLVSIVVVVILKCRRRNKEERTYNNAEKQPVPQQRNSTNRGSGRKRNTSHREIVVTVNEAAHKMDYNDIIKEEPDGQESSSPGSLTETSPPDSESKLLKKDPPKVKNLAKKEQPVRAESETDESGSGPERKERQEAGSSEDEEARLLRMLKDGHTSDESLNSTHSNHDSGRGSVHSNHDSGRGDSDKEVRSSPTADLRPQSCEGASNKTELPVETGMPPPPCNVLSRCTQECRILGHSDRCWMPVPPNNHIPNINGSNNNSPSHHSRLNSPVRNSPEKAKILKIKDFNNPSTGNGRKVTFVDQRPDSPVSYDGSHHSSPTNSNKGLNLKNSPSHVASASYRNSPTKTGKSLYEDTNRNAAYGSPNRNTFVDNNVTHRTPYEDSNKNPYSPHKADPRFTGYEAVKPNRKPLCLRTFDPNREFKGTTTLGDSSTSSEEGNELYNMEDVSEVLDNVEGTPPDSPYGDSSPYKPKELARELDELTFSSFRV